MPKAQADIYEIDSVFLPDFVAGKIRPLPDALVPNDGEYLPIAAERARVGKVAYGVPHWVCADFLFHWRPDTALRPARRLCELERILGGAEHPTGRGLLLDLKGKSALGELYLTDLVGRYGDDPEHVERYFEVLQPDAKSNLTRVAALCDPGECRSKAHHDDTGYFARRFEDGHARAYVGYSESLFDVLEEWAHCPASATCNSPTDIAVEPLPINEEPERPMVWVDMFVIDKGCTGPCLDDATAAIRSLTSEDALVDDTIRDDAPLYPELRRILETGVAPTGSHWNRRLRARGNDLDHALPQ